MEQLRPSRVHLPFFLCDSMLCPLRRLGIAVSFYGVDRRLQVASPSPDPAVGELFLAVRYFGVGGDWLEPLRLELGRRLVIDDTQAFFSSGRSDICSFNSARKFFGVPDGAYLYGLPAISQSAFPCHQPSLAHLENRRIGNHVLAFAQYQAYESALDDAPLGVSELSEARLRAIDYRAVAAARRRNYLLLDRHLSPYNELELSLGAGDVPLYYPFLGEGSLREALCRQRIWVPQLWSEVTHREGDGFAWDRKLAMHLCPLPIDQRYDEEDMKRVVATVLALTVGRAQ